MPIEDIICRVMNQPPAKRSDLLRQYPNSTRVHKICQLSLRLSLVDCGVSSRIDNDIWPDCAESCP
ncbi:hypothetical protein D3C80_1784500 [compost metagenome]